MLENKDAVETYYNYYGMENNGLFDCFRCIGEYGDIFVWSGAVLEKNFYQFG